MGVGGSPLEFDGNLRFTDQVMIKFASPTELPGGWELD